MLYRQASRRASHVLIPILEKHENNSKKLSESSILYEKQKLISSLGNLFVSSNSVWRSPLGRQISASNPLYVQ